MQFSEISPVLIPIAAMLVPIVAIVGNVVLKVMRLQLLHETVKHLADRGQPIPPELLSSMIGKK